MGGDTSRSWRHARSRYTADTRAFTAHRGIPACLMVTAARARPPSLEESSHDYTRVRTACLTTAVTVRACPPGGARIDAHTDSPWEGRTRGAARGRVWCRTRRLRASLPGMMVFFNCFFMRVSDLFDYTVIIQ